MSLELQRGKSQFWYARISLKSGSICRRLNVKVCGCVPASLRDLGDIEFERSRAQAQAAHDRLAEEFLKPRREAQLLEQIYEARTGAAVPSIALRDMTAAWEKARGHLAPRYVKLVQAVHSHFCDFIRQNFPKAKAMSDVRPDMAAAFMAEIAKAGYAGATYNAKLDALRSAFNALAAGAGITDNPFSGIAEHETHTINRRPFPIAELERILEIAKRPEHALIYPALVVASMTGMREGDCCCLRKQTINRAEGTIRVSTAKTGKPATIPIAPLLAEILDQAPPSDSDYVFPECARLYQLNPTAITDRTRAVLKDAGYFDPVPGGPSPLAPVTMVRHDGKGKRRVSVRDFHSFRASWVTIALTHGVPVELVCIVTGHSSAETLRKHYFLPDHEDFRRVLKEKLPAAMGGAAMATHDTQAALQAVEAKIALMTARNWAKVRTDIMALIARAKVPAKTA